MRKTHPEQKWVRWIGKIPPWDWKKHHGPGQNTPWAGEKIHHGPGQNTPWAGKNTPWAWKNTPWAWKNTPLAGKNNTMGREK